MRLSGWGWTRPKAQAGIPRWKTESVCHRGVSEQSPGPAALPLRGGGPGCSLDLQ